MGRYQSILKIFLVWILHHLLLLFPIRLCYLLRLRGVLRPHYSSIRCLNHVTARYNFYPIIPGLLFLVKVILRLAFHYTIFQLIVRYFLILDSSSVAMLNSKMYMIQGINSVFVNVFFATCPLMV
jgi:hypothetical protein